MAWSDPRQTPAAAPHPGPAAPASPPPDADLCAANNILVDVAARAGRDCAALAACGLDLARGGVGYYRRSDFVHLDTGAVRTWKG
jgi:hypothetical protein